METAVKEKIRSYQKVVSDEFTAFIDVKFNFTPWPEKCSGGQSKGSRSTLDPQKVRTVQRLAGGGCVILLGDGKTAKRYAKEPKGVIVARIRSAKSLQSKLTGLV